MEFQTDQEASRRLSAQGPEMLARGDTRQASEKAGTPRRKYSRPLPSDGAGSINPT